MNRAVLKSLVVLMVVWALSMTSVAFAQSPVSWWSGDNTAVDSISHDNGTLSGGVTYAPGTNNQAFSFDGTNGVVLIPDADNLKITDTLSISANIKINALTSDGSEETLVFRGDNRTSLDPYSITVSGDGRLTFHIGDSAGNVANISAPVALGRFVSFLASLNNATGEMRLYLDGQLAASGTTTVRPFRDLDSTRKPGFSIGNTSDPSVYNEPFHGLIDEVKIYNTVVTPAPPKADFNGDKQDDLIFQNSTTGQLVFWFMNGTSVTGGASTAEIPVSGYKVVGTGDFNQDGAPDLVFQNSTSGKIAIWFMTGTRFIGGASVALIPLQGYKVVGVGDINGDGLPDLVLQNASTNKVVIWYMNGTTVTGGSFISLTPASSYQVVGVYDMNGDTHPDLVLQNATTGQIAIWYLNGITVTAGVSLPLPAQGYKVAGVGSFSGSLPGLALQSSLTNQIVFWYLSGANVIGGGFASGIPDSHYQVVGPR